VYDENSKEFKKLQAKLEYILKDLAKKSESVSRTEYFRGFKVGIETRAKSKGFKISS